MEASPYMDFQSDRLYHVSEGGDVALFKPRPSPSHFDDIQGDVVFAISGKIVHNYLFPRNCPRVTFYIGNKTSQSDKEKFFGQTSASYVIAIEASWLQVVQQTRLYCYEFPLDDFSLLDECAGYFISYKEITPLSVHRVSNVFEQLFIRNVELRVLPNLWTLADEIVSSSLSFSLIRMRNATERGDTNMNKSLGNY